MAGVKSRLVRRVDSAGAVVLNVDDPRVAAMARLTRAPALYFTTEGREQEFDRGFFLRDGWLCRKDGAAVERLLAAAEMPMTFGGQARYNIANALAALAAVAGSGDRLPVPLAAQLAVLRDYERDVRDYPRGRMALTRLDGQYVLLMHCKNPDSFRLEAPLIRRIQAALGCQHLVGVLSAVGNRQEEHHRRLSEQASELSDGVFLRPPLAKFVRGLATDELTRRLSLALRPGQLLATEPLTASEMIQEARRRWGDSFLLTYFDADLVLDFDEFLREAQVVPLPE
jgi:cyanophycin synthetase